MATLSKTKQKQANKPKNKQKISPLQHLLMSFSREKQSQAHNFTEVCVIKIRNPVVTNFFSTSVQTLLRSTAAKQGQHVNTKKQRWIIGSLVLLLFISFHLAHESVLVFAGQPGGCPGQVTDIAPYSKAQTLIFHLSRIIVFFFTFKLSPQIGYTLKKSAAILEKAYCRCFKS